MEKNIFEGAKFGDLFVARNGKVAIYQHDYIEDIDDEKLNTYKIGHMLFTDDLQLICSSDGNTIFDSDELDIVSKYQEPIDEDKLEELAGLVCAKEFIGTWDMSNIVCNITNDLDQATIEAYNIGFKAGYHKAKEE